MANIKLIPFSYGMDVLVRSKKHGGWMSLVAGIATSPDVYGGVIDIYNVDMEELSTAIANTLIKMQEKE